MTGQNEATKVAEVKKEDIIFSGIYSDEGDVIARRQELITSFKNANVFQNEYFVFYTILKDFPKVKTPTKDFLSLFLRTNSGTFQKHPNIDLLNYRLGDNDPYVEFVNSTLAIFDECVRREVNEDDFYLNIEMHKMEYVNKKALSALEEGSVILSEGVQKGNKTLVGYEDMRASLTTQLAEIDNVLQKKERKGIVVYGVNTSDEEEEDQKLQKVSNFGIQGLDEVFGGLYEGDMMSLLAPPKGCKSRLSAFIMHHALVSGVNSAVWSIENGQKGFEYLIRARHFNWFYNSKETDVTKRAFIDSDMIRKDELTPELKAMERASWLDLQTNANYGKFINIDEDFNSANCFVQLKRAIEDYGAKLLCVDYLQLLSGEGRKTQTEAVAEIYKEMLQFVKRYKVAGIFPAQIKQTAIGDISRVDADELVNLELRDAGGASAEVIRTPDINLMLWGTAESIRNGDMKILSVPSRNAKPFQPIDLLVDAGTCTFSQASA